MKARIGLILLVLLLIPKIALANGGAVAIIMAQEEALKTVASQDTTCLPPLKFAIENNCTLEYTRAVGTYDCHILRVYTDCQGNITKITNRNDSEGMSDILVDVILVLLGMAVGLAFLGWLIQAIKGEKNGN